MDKIILNQDDGVIELLHASTEPHVVIYSDGACSGNPGPGGWGAVVAVGHRQWLLSGAAPQTTNNRMEMLAVIRSLEALPKPSQVDIYTDSQYLKDGMTLWVKKWVVNNWQTASKQPVKNQDLWQNLMILSEKHKIKWHWVKGHSGHPQNEQADALARSAIVAQSINH